MYKSQADFSPDILCPFTANSNSYNVIPEVTCCEGGNEYSMLGRKGFEDVRGGRERCWWDFYLGFATERNRSRDFLTRSCPPYKR